MIHRTAVIHSGVEFFHGNDVDIGAFCELGSPDGALLRIGDGALIRSHSIIYGGSEYGPGLETGHWTLLRSGNCVGRNLRIGSYSSLEGGANIGDFVRIHGRVEMTRARIGNFAHIYGGSYLTDNMRPPSAPIDGDVPWIGDGAVLCMGVIVLPGVRIGMGAYVAAGTVVEEDVPDCHLLRRNGKLRPLRRFWPETWDAYPPEATEPLAELLARMKEVME